MEPFPFPCHPDRSEAKRRDLRFRGPFDEMFFDGAKRPTHLSDNRGFYGAKSKDLGDAYWQMLFGAFRPQTTKACRASEAQGPAVQRTLPGNVFHSGAPNSPRAPNPPLRRRAPANRFPNQHLAQNLAHFSYRPRLQNHRIEPVVGKA